MGANETPQMKALSPEVLKRIIPQLPPDKQIAAKVLLEELNKRKYKQVAQSKFLTYVKHVWPSFIHGRHHEIMADAFERVAKGELKRLIINMPPRHTKSEFASYLLPSWFLGKFPTKKVIQTSHTAELATDFGRKVRNLVDNPTYKEIFPNVALQSDSKAAGRWNTSHGGTYFAIGVGGAVTGKGADLLIIDDPHSEQEAILAEVNPDIYDKVYEWYSSGPRQRLQPGGSIVIVMCMTGDTPVLMANGEEKPLKNIRPGDVVATFDEGRLATSKILNHRSSGVDSIYKIQTQSGKILRANKRHPFLVMNEGVLEWTRLAYLEPGDMLVSLKDAIDSPKLKQNLGSVGHVAQESRITEKTQTHRTGLWEVMGCGRALHALKKGVCVLYQAVVYVQSITTKNTPQNQPQKRTEPEGLNIVTASLLSNMIQWFRSAITYAMCVASPQQKTTLAPTGTESSALTTAMIQDRSEDFFATTATLPLGTERRQIFLNELRRTSDFTADPIVSITPDGTEEVFDVEVDRTENFIANGFVSHNTRWSKRDLTAQVVKASLQRGGEEWEVIELPAILPSGASLWPEFWNLDELTALKEELPVHKWMAQYMQAPTGAEGALIKKEWWQEWEHDDPPACDYIIQSWDTAHTKNTRSDYSACVTLGIFHPEDEPAPQIILIDAYKERLEFPELKAKALEKYKEFQPDCCIIEAKAAGAPLLQELRKMGIPIQDYTPVRGNDKITRVNAVADLFASKMIWAPKMRWAEEVIEEFASFPAGEHDDLVDAMTQALLRFRQGGLVRLTSDEPDEPREFRRRGKGYY